MMCKSKSHRHKQPPARRKRAHVDVQPLLVSRRDAALMLGGVDVSTVRRLERMGVLVAVKLARTAKAQTFYVYDNVVAAAKGYIKKEAAE